VVQHLDQMLARLFADFTGLHFHISWAPLSARKWEAHSLPTACSVCCRLRGSPRRKDCDSCGPQQLIRALRQSSGGHHFTCRLGVRNYWLPIRVRAETLGIAYLQALDHVPAPPKLRPGARAGKLHRRPTEARHLGNAEFTRAARLLQLIIEHVQTASLSDLRKTDLTAAGHAVIALEKEQARLHETLERHLPPAASPTTHFGPESHPAQVVHRLLDSIERNYGKPITLRQCAAQLGMNPTYLSDLFSRTVGIPFKTYLTDLRLQRAKELLGNAGMPVAEVAFAVGYVSENRFRIAFKQATGIPPKVWRETMQPDSLALS
jgi:AraC-like DNA-binding protein